MPTADYRYEIDWNNSGLFDHPCSDISGYVLNASWQSGRPNGPPERAIAGTFQARVDNSTSIFSPFNQDSPLFGLILPGLRIRVSMRIGAEPFEPQWAGRLQAIDPVVGDRTSVSYAELSGYGGIAKLTEGETQVPLQENIPTGSAVAALLESYGLAESEYSVEPGQSTISKWWVRPDSRLLDAIRELEAEELGFFREAKDGRYLFEDRSHLFTASRSSTVQAIYGIGSLHLWRPRQMNPIQTVFNQVRAEVKTFNVTEPGTLLATIADVANGQGGTPPVVPGSGTLELNIDYPTPSSPSQCIAVDSWGAIDLEANTQPDRQGIDITEHIQATKIPLGPRLRLVFMNASPHPAHLVTLRARGTAIIASDPIPIRSEDSGESQRKYGKRSYPYPSQWITDLEDGQQKLDHIVASFKDPAPRISFEVMGNYDDAHLRETQARDVSDCIRVAGAAFGLHIDAEFIVDHLAHRVDEARQHVMTVSCTRASALQLGPSGRAYTPNVIAEDKSGVAEVPDQLTVSGSLLNERILFSGSAAKWNEAIDSAEFRAVFVSDADSVTAVDLRTPPEGGALVHDGIVSFIVPAVGANWQGARFQVSSGSRTGKWFFGFRFHNPQGWSVWSDGNTAPSFVRDFVASVATDPGAIDSAPPREWSLTIVPSTQPGRCQVVAGRPRLNGNVIEGNVCFQIRNARIGEHRALDENKGAAATYYDGSGVSHRYDPIAGTLVRMGTGEIAVPRGVPLLLIHDVRQGQFSRRHCLWVEVSAGLIAGSVISGLSGGLRLGFAPDPDGTYSDVRLKIVKAPWGWGNADGYLGYAGFFDQGKIRRGEVNWPLIRPTDTTYSTPPMPIPPGCTIQDLEARVWFQNGYSIDDDDCYSDVGSSVSPSAGVICVSVSGSTTIDCNMGSVFMLYLTRDTVLHIINAPDCRPFLVIFVQDALGGRTVTLEDDEFSEGLDSAFAIAPEPLARSYVVMSGNALTGKIDVLSSTRGYQQ